MRVLPGTFTPPNGNSVEVVAELFHEMDALDKLDDCDEDTFRDAQSIIELLKENISLWKEEDGHVDDL